MKKSSVYDCTIIELDKHHHEKGNISVVENDKTIPFEIKRTYYLYDVPGGESRGGHAHKELSQLIIAASGSFTDLRRWKCKTDLPIKSSISRVICGSWNMANFR